MTDTPHLERIAAALTRHKIEAQSGSESGITVLCTCKHQSTASGFRAARERHYQHVAQAALDALQLTEEWAGDCINTETVRRGEESRYCLHESFDEAEDYHVGLNAIVSRLVSPWVVVEPPAAAVGEEQP